MKLNKIFVFILCVIILGSIVWFSNIKSLHAQTTPCVVALGNSVYADILVTSDGVVFKKNEAGVFVVPIKYNGTTATLHRKSKLEGLVWLNLDKNKIQIIKVSSLN